MDIFKFRNPNNPMQMEQGEIVDGLKSKMWIERYREAGEFTLVGSIDSGIREKLPLGTFISHTGTADIMIVENHEVSDDRGQKTDITITGRGLETILEQRIVSANRSFPNNLGSADYVLASNYTWLQALSLVENHILPAYVIDDNDALPFLQIINQIGSPGSAVISERSVKRGDDLYSALVGLLEVDKLGLKVYRPGPWSPMISADTIISIYAGADRSSQVVFSFDTGEIESADYLWSKKKLKNSALVSGKWVEVRIDSLSAVQKDRRMMYVDASDIDDALTEAPTGTDLAQIITKMEQRGITALAAQKDISLSKTEVSKENSKAIYRQDFNIGDLIMVSGDYNATMPMRVTEFVEIDDENGQKSYPTLAVDDQ